MASSALSLSLSLSRCGPRPPFSPPATKRGAVKRNWKRRYFVLRNDATLAYYKDQHVEASKPKVRPWLWARPSRRPSAPRAHT